VTAKKLPIGVDDFETMITQDYVYVDKTKYIYDLITKGRLYFLSRPRRFGKSLLISTLEHIFSGNKELFHDLWIGKQSDYTWPQHPVIHLDLSSLEPKTPERLELDLSLYLNEIAQGYGLKLEGALLTSKMRELVKKLAQKNKVVLLIDEYDYPILEHITRPEIAKSIRDFLKIFFTVIKSLAGKYMRFVFITGITEFSKTSLFSGMNNLDDITLSPSAALLLGYTKNEIEYYFQHDINLFAKSSNESKTTIIQEMESWYNGYCFSEKVLDQKIYNPFSILHCLHNQKLDNYWFKSATPIFLVELIKKHYYAPEYLHITDVTLSSAILGTFDIDSVPPLYTLLFQTGYLTIKSFDKARNAYTLTYPNEEVRQSIAIHMIGIITNKGTEKIYFTVLEMRRALEEHALDTFCSQLRSLLAGIPYNLYVNNEAYFHSLLYLIVNLLGLDSKPEELTNKGRIDLVVSTANNIYLFELKYNATAQQALQQIQDKKYYEKYLNKKKPITLIGLSFNYEDKAIALDCSALPLDEKVLTQETKEPMVKMTRKGKRR
jgi:hypothetical protein